MPSAASASKPVGTRMERRRLRTRQQIIEAARELLLQVNYEDISAEAIAELADVGRSTFYNHFSNKQDAVLATLSYHYRNYGEDAYVSAEQEPDRAIAMIRTARELFHDMANDALTRRLIDQPRVLFGAIAESQTDLMLRDLTDGLTQGRFQFIVDLDNLATAMAWALVGVLIKAIGEDDVAAICDDWCRLILINLGLSVTEIPEVLERATTAAKY
ncbi:MAG: TetR/AcrR family transcriptional regulator [Pseudomonadota bacterium]